MPKYYDEDGNEIELEQPIDEIKTKLESFEEEKNNLIKEKEELANKIKGFEDKDFNFSALREKAEKKEEELTQTEKLLLEKDTQINKLVDSIHSGWKDKIMESFVGSDKELKEGIEKTMETINIEANTEAEMRDKIRQAYILHTGTVPEATGNINSSFSNSSAPGEQGLIKKEIPDDLKKFGKDFAGLTDEDFNEYEGKKTEKKSE
jgi:predicted RNase H-like nuclease (RuvC/YqgF family)